MPDTDIVVPNTLQADIQEFTSRYYQQITNAYETRDSSIGWLGPVIDWTEDVSEERGWEYLDSGGARLVIKIPTTACNAYSGPPLVVKVPIYRDHPEDGRYQNACEANLWSEAPAELRPYLVPVLASGHLYRWLLMPYADAESADQEMVEPRSRELVHKQGIATNEVVAAQNWGVWNGEPRLIDYGHNISPYVLDEAAQVSVEAYAPEIPESYENNEDDEGGSGENDEAEEHEEVRDAPEAEQVVLDGSGLLLAQKRKMRGKIAGRIAVAGQVLDIESIEIRVVSTIPSTNSAFGADETSVTDETQIRFD